MSTTTDASSHAPPDGGVTTAPPLPTSLRPAPEPAPPPPGDGRRDGLLVIFAVVAVMALLGSVVAIGFGIRAVDESKDNTAGASATGAEAAPTVVRLSELKIEPAAFEATEGSTLRVENGGTVAHDLHIEGGPNTPLVDPGATAELSLEGLAPGTYTVFCAVAGHREAGMRAELKILASTAAAGAGTAGTSATHDMGTSTEPMTADEMDELMARATKAFPAKTEGVGGQTLRPTLLADGTKQFNLTTSIVRWEVEPGRFVDAWTYNGTVPGPTLKVDPGDKVKVVVKNGLPESTAVHFHGLTIPNAVDGVPDITQPPIKPGQTFTYAFAAQSTPAVGMYHSHHNATKQVGNGLAGAILVGAEPVPAGVAVAQEHVMMLNDTGTIGFSLNGKSFPATQPYTAALGEWIEVHYMNEGVMAHPMHLHGLAQQVIAKDGFPLAQPYTADTIMVGPGERYTVLVQASQPGVWAWHCHILNHAERDDGMFGMVTALIVT